MSKEKVILERRFVPEGSVFIREDDQGYSAYLIQSGTVSVYSERDGKIIEFARLGQGQICGEMALINQNLRNANVRALEDCNLIVITKTSFEEKLHKTDPTIRAVTSMLIERIKQSNTNLLGRDDLESFRQLSGSLIQLKAKTLSNAKKDQFEKMAQKKINDFLGFLDTF